MAIFSANKEAFVYCWTDHYKEMFYIGYHKGTENDGYVCSSTHMNRAYKKRTNDFTRQILASGSEADMYAFESLLLKKLNVKSDDQFYNKSNNTPPLIPWNRGKKGLQTAWNKGKKGSQTAWNKGLSKEQQPRYGKIGGMTGKTGSQKQRDAVRKSITKLNNERTFDNACPHCDYVGYYTQQWHWDNCKQRGIL